MFGPALILLQRRVEAQPILAIALGLKIPCPQPTSFEAKSLGCNLFPLRNCGMLLGLFWRPLKWLDHWRKLLREFQQIIVFPAFEVIEDDGLRPLGARRVQVPDAHRDGE